MLGEIEMYDKEGMRVQFWRIPRQWNEVADQHAKEAVHDTPGEEFNVICGFFT
jgi:ribonuclease HI